MCVNEDECQPRRVSTKKSDASAGGATVCTSDLGLGRFNNKVSGVVQHSQSATRKGSPRGWPIWPIRGHPQEGTGHEAPSGMYWEMASVRTMALSDLSDKRDRRSSLEQEPWFVPRAGSYGFDIAIRGLRTMECTPRRSSICERGGLHQHEHHSRHLLHRQHVDNSV